MEYRLRIGEKVHVIAGESFNFSEPVNVTVGEVTHSLSANAIDEHHFLLQIDGMCVNAFVATTDEGTWISIGGRQRLVHDADKSESRKRSAPGRVPNEVTPPTPATAIRVLAEVDQLVEAGQPLVVVSAMKMEMTLAAPYSGRVTAVNTTVGARVRPGEILVEIERAMESEDDD